MKKTTALLIITSLVTHSCKKEGVGGSATIATIVQHHSKDIPYSTVYVKYGTNKFPGNDVSKYDANQKTDKKGHTHFESLVKGNYYFYAVGFDSAISAIVVGGVPVTIERKDKEAELDIFVPVVEE